MKLLLLTALCFLFVTARAQDTTYISLDSSFVGDTTMPHVDTIRPVYYDTAPFFYIVFLRGDSVAPYATRQVQGYRILVHNVPGHDSCNNPVYEIIDPLIYLDDKKKPIDWSRFERYEERVNK